MPININDIIPLQYVPDNKKNDYVELNGLIRDFNIWPKTQEVQKKITKMANNILNSIDRDKIKKTTIMSLKNNMWNAIKETLEAKWEHSSEINDREQQWGVWSCESTRDDEIHDRNQ